MIRLRDVFIACAALLALAGGAVYELARVAGTGIATTIQLGGVVASAGSRTGLVMRVDSRGDPILVNEYGDMDDDYADSTTEPRQREVADEACCHSIPLTKDQSRLDKDLLPAARPQDAIIVFAANGTMSVVRRGIPFAAHTPTIKASAQ